MRNNCIRQEIHRRATLLGQFGKSETRHASSVRFGETSSSGIEKIERGKRNGDFAKLSIRKSPETISELKSVMISFVAISLDAPELRML